MPKQKKTVADPAEQIRDHDYNPKVNLKKPPVTEIAQDETPPDADADGIQVADADTVVNMDGVDGPDVKDVRESFDRKDIIANIISKDATKIAEAKNAIKSLLDARAAQFRAESAKFIAQSLFEQKD